MIALSHAPWAASPKRSPGNQNEWVAFVLLTVNRRRRLTHCDKLHGDAGPWDRDWGLRWVSGPFPRGIQARTNFASGHRVTEWAVPFSLLGVTPCETVALNVFTCHDRNGTMYADASGGDPGSTT